MEFKNFSFGLDIFKKTIDKWRRNAEKEKKMWENVNQMNDSNFYNMIELIRCLNMH